MRGRVDRLMMLVEMFPGETSSYMTNIDQALLDGDEQTLRAMGHALKGVAGTLSAHQLQEAAEGLELAASTDNKEDVAAVYPVLKRSYSEFTQLLQREVDAFNAGQPTEVEEEVPSISLNTFLSQLAQRLRNSDYVDPTELKQLSPFLQEPEKIELLESLRGHISQFDNLAALKTLEQLATSEGIALARSSE